MSREFIRMAQGERTRRGTPEQRRLFLELWDAYWEQKVLPHPLAHRRVRSWRQALALFEQTWQVHHLAIQEAALKRPRL